MNRRYLKQTEDETTRYIYSNENILQEITTDETTITTKDYINGIGVDDLIAYEENNNTYYFHKNHLGSVEGITDSSGNIVVSYEYDSFGNFEITSGANSGNTRLYTGREYNSEIGLYYNRARYYNPELGRFISRDPIGQIDDVNLYGYVGNNGVNFVDRSGLSKVLIFVAKDKTFMGLTYSTLETSKNILVNNYLEKGFKEENIHIVFGNTLKDFTDSLILNEYKEIGLVAHSNSDGIDLDASIENSSAIIVDNNLSKLPILNNDTILTIIGCHAGNGNNSIAQKISNQMRIEVLATENFINNDGEKFINGGSSGWNTLYYGLRQFDAEFLTFKPE
ncbi:MAG: hypothetical protein PHV23_00905 [Candidatus Gracilibacteria bacterium]|nr:hypothetical protein [Candidatus Gracilibacteria bacterium]